MDPMRAAHRWGAGSGPEVDPTFRLLFSASSRHATTGVNRAPGSDDTSGSPTSQRPSPRTAHACSSLDSRRGCRTQPAFVAPRFARLPTTDRPRDRVGRLSLRGHEAEMHQPMMPDAQTREIPELVGTALRAEPE